MRRRTAITSVALASIGCAPPAFKPLEFPPDVVLQDPMPGTAIAYLLRIPRDGATIEVYAGARKLAVLPPSTYTAVSLMPGTHEIASASSGSAPSGPTSVLTVGDGERRFLYTSVPSDSSVSLRFAPLKGGAMLPLMTPTTVPVGARVWRECNELDAQGLMSTSKLVLPEPGAV